MQFFSHLLVFVTLFVLCLTDTDIHNLTTSQCGVKEKAPPLLDVSMDLINKAKDMYPNYVEDDLNCGQKEKSFAYLDAAMNVISEVKKSYPTCPKTECPKYVEKPMDCSEVLRNGKKTSGAYAIWPRNRAFTMKLGNRTFINKPLPVYCDMDTDGGGWTVIQRRGNFSTPQDNFAGNWESYKKGFGNISAEFYLGNKNIFAISNQAKYTIRFDLTNAAGETAYAEYKTFWIEDETAYYTLHIKGYSGNAGDSMSEQNNMKFHTLDLNHGSFCTHRNAVWFSGCDPKANPNGRYLPGVDSERGIIWFHWKMNYEGLSKMEIKLRV